MTIWVDAQISPALAPWLSHAFNLDAVAVRDLNRVGAEDLAIFRAAHAAGAVILTKDRDFVELVLRHGPPPQVLWVTCGNTSTPRLRRVLSEALPPALEWVRRGEPLVEITDASAG